MTDTLEKMVSAAKPGEVVPIMSGMTKMAGAFYYRIMLNVFSKGGYDDNFLDHKLPRFLPVISSIKSKLYPIARQVKKHYFLNTDMSDEDEFKPRFAHFLTVSQFSSHVPRLKRLHMLCLVYDIYFISPISGLALYPMRIKIQQPLGIQKCSHLWLLI